MKITILGITFEPTTKDFTRVKSHFVKAWNWFDERRKKELFIAFADERYYTNGHIVSWGRIKISRKQLEALCSTERDWVEGLSDYLTEQEYKQYVLEDSGELNGYETDTPENFDIIIKI